MFTALLDALLLSVLVTPAIGFIGRKIRREKVLVGAYITLILASGFLIILTLYWEVLERSVEVIASSGPERASIRIDGFSIFITVILFTVGISSSIFSIKEIRRFGSTGFYTIYLAMIAAIVGVVFSGDLLTFFIFWEVMCLCSYALVTFHKERWEQIEAGYKYLIMSSSGSIIVLFALSFLYGLTGTLSIQHLAASLRDSQTNSLIYISLLMIIVGFGLQAGMVPFHTWLPDAHMAASSSISAVLSGVVVKIGIYGLIRLLLGIFLSTQNAWRMVMAVFAVSTMFIGNLSALFQDDLKRLLAYSTIANTGYVLLGLSMESQRALAGSLLQMMNHAVVKALLFLCAGAFLFSTRTRSLREIAGIKERMPLTSIAFVIGALALATFPGLNVFWSEMMIITAGIESDMPILSFLMIINLVLSAVYALRMIYTVAMMKATSTSKNARRIPRLMLLPILSLAAASILMGIYPSPFMSLAELGAASLNP